jgi:hypothetical protein
MSSSCIFSLLVACMAVEKQLYLTASRPGLGPTQSLVRCVTPALSSEKSRTESEANYSPTSSFEVKNMWRYTSNSVRLHGVMLNKCE